MQRSAKRLLVIAVAAALLFVAATSTPAEAQCGFGDCPNSPLLGSHPAESGTAPSPFITGLWNAAASQIPPEPCDEYTEWLIDPQRPEIDATGPWFPGRYVNLLGYDSEYEDYLGAVQEILADCNFSGQRAARHCFEYIVHTPGRLRANPDPGLVGFEAWFWLEGRLGGDQSPNPASNVFAIALDSGSQPTAIWNVGWEANPPPSNFPTYDGVFLRTGASIEGPGGDPDESCSIYNVGRLLAGTTNDYTGTWVIPEVGQYYGDAVTYFQNGIRGVPNDTPMHYPGAYTIRQHSVRYGIDLDEVRFTGTLTLGPYAWNFGDGTEIDLSWPEGAGVPLPSNPADYATYAGQVKHTYNYHGRFGARVSVQRNLIGQFQ